MTKIGILDPLGRHGGFHYYTEGLARALSDVGVSVTLYGFEVPCSDPAYDNINTFKRIYGLDPSWKRGLRYLQGLIFAVVDAKKRGLGLIHIHCFHYDLREILSALFARLWGFRVVLTLHDIESFGSSRGNFGRGILLALSNGLIVQNEFSRRTLESAVDLRRTIVEVVPHPHYIDQYPDPQSRDEARQSLNLDGSHLIILFFGNPRPEKGLDLLLEAMERTDITDALLVVAGKIRDVDLGRLRDLEVGPLKGRLRVDAGRISDEDAERYYRASDIVAVPYHKIYESGVAIMAMSFSRFVLHSDLPPLVEGVGEAGLAFKAGDADDLVSRLKEAEAIDRDAYGQLGRKRVEDRRGATQVSQGTLSLYKRAMGYR